MLPGVALPWIALAGFVWPSDPRRRGGVAALLALDILAGEPFTRLTAGRLLRDLGAAETAAGPPPWPRGRRRRGRRGRYPAVPMFSTFGNAPPQVRFRLLATLQ
jgi:hypothetical protein